MECGWWSWRGWGRRFNRYLQRLEKLLWPDLIILGGGGVEYLQHFRDSLKVSAAVVPAQMGNDAGIVGAALAGESYQAD